MALLNFTVVHKAIMKPQPHPLLHRNDDVPRTDKPVPDGTMSAVHFGDISQPVKLVFLHANGFNGLTYRSILENLGVHVIALDLRGHGLTDLPASHDKQAFWAVYADDLIAYLNTHISGPVVVAGHSLGAGVGLIAAQKVPAKITRVLAFDPIILPCMIRWIMVPSFGRKFMRNRIAMSKAAGRRRDEFPNLEAVFERYHGRGMFKGFTDEALWDYVSGGFVPHKDGVRLACRPAWEQYTFSSQSANLKSALSLAPDGSHAILTGFIKQNQHWISKTNQKRPEIKIEYRKNLKHFFPLYHPELSQQALRDILAN